MSLPAFFPLVRPGCEEVSKDFFQCYDQNNQPFGDQIAAKKAIEECKIKQGLYEKCTEESLKTGPKTNIAVTRSK